MEYHSAIKNEILTFGTTWMDLESIILSEVSQTEKYKHHRILFMCRICKRKQVNTKQKQTHRYREQTDGCLRAGR